MDFSQPSTSHKEKHPDNRISLRNVLIFAGLCVSLFSLYFAYQALDASTEAQKANTQVQRSLKEIDLRRSFQERYNNLTADTASSVKDEEGAKAYYRSYWRLQLEEYQYWCEGMIDEDLYATWAKSRRRDFDKNDSFKYKGGSYNYRQGWQYMKDYFTERDRGKNTQYASFMRFFDGVIFGSPSVSPNPRVHCERRR